MRAWRKRQRAWWSKNSGAWCTTQPHANGSRGPGVCLRTPTRTQCAGITVMLGGTGHEDFRRLDVWQAGYIGRHDHVALTSASQTHTEPLCGLLLAAWEGSRLGSRAILVLAFTRKPLHAKSSS